MSGKGDSYRKVNRAQFNDNFDAIFGVKPPHVCKEWVRGNDGMPRCYYCNEPRPIDIHDQEYIPDQA